jgi:hypothetical protein
MAWLMLWIIIMKTWLARLLTKAENGLKNLFAKIQAAHSQHPLEVCVFTASLIFLFIALEILVKS